MAILQVEFLENLAQTRLDHLLNRARENVNQVLEDVRLILAAVRGDKEAEGKLSNESRRFHQQYQADLASGRLEVSPDEIDAAYRSIDPRVLEALKIAAANIETFHRAQREREMWAVEIRPGILAGRLARPIPRVGCYIPGGLASYPSSALMNILPARVAGVKEIIACTPPGKDLAVNPATLVAAHLAGAHRLFKLGGPWAIGSLAYGTDLVPKVDKITGPGNKYVTAAKLLVFGEVDIDSPAGPSEALIVADEAAEARFVAADFLSQVEHDQDAAALLVTPDATLAHKVVELILGELPSLPRRHILEGAIKTNSAVLVTRDLDEALSFANRYAPEHLQIMTRDPFAVLPRIEHAGSIFLGSFAPVPVGDYASGTNHVLPTGGCARMFSGLSVDDFMKKPTFQHLSREGLAGLKDAVVLLAETEGLPLHARAVAERFRYS
jgi:histidinol dehydrogenase|uniref:Histidinol dehydrogenase n=1 Tax=Desulfobacca acetoxidans TaxID=60893 RepID=A0A7V6DRB7_9BACT